MPAIAVHGLRFAYRQTPVLRDVSFEIPAQETVCLVGPNGGGKSTLLKLMLGLLQPSAGSVHIFGQSPEKARRRIGYMPQYAQFDPQFPITVREIVLSGRLGSQRWGFFTRKDREIADRCLEEMELGTFAKRHFHDLSGGQKQRVLIARALAVEPDVLFLDEPTAMVDAHLEARLLEQIKALHRRLTIVLVSHDAAFVASLVERVLCVQQSVTEHPLETLSGDHLHHLYGHEVRAVRHDHGCCLGSALPGGGDSKDAESGEVKP
jgi:zinc transport system ATP-binding protein